MGIILREYQKNILKTCLLKNTLVILPTGTGKTIIAFFLIKERLNQYPNKKIYFLAPTKPLVIQHYQNFIKIFPEYSKISVVITGDTKPTKRESLYKTAQIIFVTPQTLYNDLVQGRVNFYNASTIIFDEAHRAVGKYPYVFIAKKIVEQAENPRIIGLTASPGWNKERIQQIIDNLYIEEIEIRTGYEKDIRQYIKKIEIRKVDVELTPEILEIKKLLEDALEIRWKKIKELIDINKVKGKRELLELQKHLINQIENNNIKTKEALILLGEIIKIDHAIELLETQTLYTLYSYFKELEERQKVSVSRPLKNILEDIRIKKAILLTKKLIEDGKEHPKLYKLLEIVKENNNKKIIIFAQIRKTVDKIVEILSKNGVKVQKFIGKKEMSQKEQIRTLLDFKEGKYNVLVATSVGEEGIDIPKVDLVIFYEPVPSEIRSIQRRGRTGRTDVGEVIILVTKRTRDEIFYWVAIQKERKMLKFVKELKKYIKPKMVEKVENRPPEKPLNIEQGIIKYLKKEGSIKKTVPIVIADFREKDSSLVQTLAELGVIVKLDKLDIGDYIAGEYIIERKTILDFIKSIFDKRLFNQLEKLKGKKALLILEGEEDLIEEAGLNPNYLRTILLNIQLKYNIPIIRSKNFIETANYIYLLAKESYKLEKPTLEKKSIDLNKIKVNMLMQIPGIGENLAKALLKKFKTIKAIANAKKIELSSVVGETKAERLKKVFEEEYKEE